MINEIMHVGLTVSNMDKSIKFYRDVLGLNFIGEILMEGPETDLLFGRKNVKARVAYLNGGKDIMCPPVELIQFIDDEIELEPASLYKTSISEICFRVDDIDKTYRHLLDNNVICLSSPQSFDFTKSGFGKSKAIYFKDPDGIILELMQEVK